MTAFTVYGEQIGNGEQPAAAPDVTNTEKLGAVLRLFPHGEAFRRDAGWVPAVARAIARFFSRVWRRKRDLERNLDPRHADELLPDWERMLGLSPAADQSLEDRRDAVIAKIRNLGGMSAPYYQQLAIDFGYADATVAGAAATIMTCIGPCTGPVMDVEYKVTFVVTAASQGAARDQLLQDLINGQLLAGWRAFYELT